MNSTNRSIVGGSIEKQVESLFFWCEQFYKEINWWFDLRSKVKEPQPILKPICIEIYEFTNYLHLTYNKLNEAVNYINKIYSSAGRDTKLSFIERDAKKAVLKCKNQLEYPRNVVAAHRYTNKKGQFITIEDVIDALNSISWDNLEQVWDEISKVYKEFESWLSNPINKNHLVLADQLAKK